MKTIILAFLLSVALTFQADAQSRRVYENVTKNTTGAVWLAKAFANSGADTSVAVLQSQAIHTELLIVANDSIDVTVSFLPSYDGVTFGAKVAIGSAWQGPITSGIVTKGFAIPDGYKSCPKIKWVVAFTSSGNGVTSATFSAKTCKVLIN